MKSTIRAAILVIVALMPGCHAEHLASPKPTPPQEPVSGAGATPVGTGPASVLVPGAVTVIQHRLQDHKYLTCPCDRESIDDRTRAALARFQKHEGLPPTGLPTYETVEHLGLNVSQVFRRAAFAQTQGSDGGTDGGSDGSTDGGSDSGT